MTAPRVCAESQRSGTGMRSMQRSPRYRRRGPCIAGAASPHLPPYHHLHPHTTPTYPTTRATLPTHPCTPLPACLPCTSRLTIHTPRASRTCRYPHCLPHRAPPPHPTCHHPHPTAAPAHLPAPALPTRLPPCSRPSSATACHHHRINTTQQTAGAVGPLHEPVRSSDAATGRWHGQGGGLPPIEGGISRSAMRASCRATCRRCGKQCQRGRNAVYRAPYPAACCINTIFFSTAHIPLMVDVHCFMAYSSLTSRAALRLYGTAHFAI